ncbi:MAG: Rrf2 family transcriptional regulator [Planctomycetota bacterium]
MLKLTRRTEYGLIALVHLTDREGEVVSSTEIGERYPVPKRLLAEALKALQQAGLLHSTRGAHGGYSLTRSADEITLGEIVTALEGRPTLTSCEGLGALQASGACDVQHVCPIRTPLQRLRTGMWNLLEGVSLRSLADRSVNPTDLFASEHEPAAILHVHARALPQAPGLR